VTLIAPLLLTLLGQADSPAELSPMQVTAGRQESSVFDVSRAVSVVDREQLEIATPLIPADLLRGLPGVYLQQTTPGQGIPIIRGLKGSENLHLVDGFRLNNAFFRNAPNQYLALVPATNLERVEVVRGPASALYGSDAMGGAVQLITRQPEFGTPIRYESRLQMSSADHAITASGAVEGGDEDSAWRLHAALQDVGDRKTARGTVSPSAYQARSLATSYRQQANEHLEWRVDLQAVRQPSTPRVDELLPGFGQDEADSAEFQFEPNQRTFVHGILQGDDLPIADHWQVHLGYQQIRDDRRSRNTGSNQRRLENNSSDLWGLTAQFDRLVRGWSLVYGFEHYRDKVESDRRGVDILDATTQDLIARFPDGSTQRSSAV
jgi:outer membrane receptor protein involved in Fe transport